MAKKLKEEEENLKILEDNGKRYQIAIRTGKRIREEAESFKNKVETLAKKMAH